MTTRPHGQRPHVSLKDRRAAARARRARSGRARGRFAVLWVLTFVGFAALVFRAASGAPVLVIASGAHRVDEAKVAALVGEPIGRADPAFVRAATGYAIGGIPPLAHVQPLTPIVDRNLLQY